MFCPECGTQLPDNAKFCPKCGHASINAKMKENVEETNKGNAVKEHGISCPKCGASGCQPNNREWTCVKCGHTFRLRPDAYKGIKLCLYFAYAALLMGIFVVGACISGKFLDLQAIIITFGLCAIFVAMIPRIPKRYDGSTVERFLTKEEKEQLKQKAKIGALIAIVVFVLPFIFTWIGNQYW